LNRRLNSSLSLERVRNTRCKPARLERGRASVPAAHSKAGADAHAEAEVALARSTESGAAEGEGQVEHPCGRTLEREEPILTTDAQGDPRFGRTGLGAALRLKSVFGADLVALRGARACLRGMPRAARSLLGGRTGAAVGFADQLALAICNARLHQELEQKTAQLLQQKHAVEQLSRGQAREIVRLKARGGRPTREPGAALRLLADRRRGRHAARLAAGSIA